MGDKTGHFGSMTESIGGGQKLKTDSGPDRNEPMKNFNPTMTKGGDSMKDAGLSRSISGGKVPSMQSE